MDRLEQILLSVALVWFLVSNWPAVIDFTANFLGSLRTSIWVFSEAAIIVFTLFRQPTEHISQRPLDWVTAIAATALPLFAKPAGEPWYYEIGIILLTIGFSIHVGAKLSLNFSFGIVAANRGVKQNGLYTFIRHPMYLGYIVAHIGFFLTAPSLHNTLVYSAVWTFFVLRIFAEERILMQDQAYREFAKKTRYRLIPKVF